MSDMPIVVMVSGRAGEGKTTFSQLCMVSLRQVSVLSSTLSFAYGVKATAKAMGWDGEKDDKGRRLLQQIGNTGREYNEDIWADMVVGNILESQVSVVFIDDWRFPNEGNVVLGKFPKVLTIRICRPEEFHTLNGSKLYDDISETSLPDIESGYYTHIIDNIGSKDELRAMAKDFVTEEVLPKLTYKRRIENV